MSTTIAVGKNVAFSGETENLETGDAVYFEGEVVLVDVELWHDGTHPSVLTASYDVSLSFDGFRDVAVHVVCPPLGDERTAFGTVIEGAVANVGLSIVPTGVGDAIVNALNGGL